MFFILGNIILAIHELAVVASLPAAETRSWLRHPPYCKVITAQPNPLNGKPGRRLASGVTPSLAATALGLIYLPQDNVAINPLIDPAFTVHDTVQTAPQNTDAPTYQSLMLWGTAPFAYPLLTALADIDAILRATPPRIVTGFDLTSTGHLIERPIPVDPFYARRTT